MHATDLCCRDEAHRQHPHQRRKEHERIRCRFDPARDQHAARVPERGAGDHADDETAGRTDCQRVNPCRARQHTELRETNQREAKRNPQIRQVQHPQDRRATSCPRVPAAQPGRLQHCSQQGNRARPCTGVKRPQQEGDARGDRRSPVELLVPPLTDAAQAIEGEHRDHPSAHDGFEHHHQTEGKMHRHQRIRLDHAEHRQMEEQVGQRQRRGHGPNEVVARALALDQHAQQHACRDRQEGEIDDRYPGAGTKGHGEPASQPDRSQRREWLAHGRLQSGPVPRRGVQEADNDRRGKAEDHLVRMPPDAGHGQIDAPSVTHRPYRYGDGCEQGGEQIEGPETERPEREGFGGDAFACRFVEANQRHV